MRRVSIKQLFFLLVFLGAATVATGSEFDSQGSKSACKGILVPFRPRSAQQLPALSVLPEPFQPFAANPGLRHLDDLATRAESRSIGGIKVHLLEWKSLDPSLFIGTRAVSSKEVLRLPEDLLHSEELEKLQSQVQGTRLESIWKEPHEIPVIHTTPIVNVRIMDFMGSLAVTEAGDVVALSSLLSIGRTAFVETRIHLAFSLAEIKRLSDFGVIPKLLGVTRLENGTYAAVFPVPASHVLSTVNQFQIGIDVALGLRHRRPESLEGQLARLGPFEELLHKLVQSDWPLIHYGIDFDRIVGTDLEDSIPELLSLLDFPLWEPRIEGTSPIFYPSMPALMSAGHSAWLPLILGGPLSALKTDAARPLLSVTTLKKGVNLSIGDRLVHVPLEPLEPSSKYGRITLLRFQFLSLLMNGEAVIRYLKQLEEHRPESYRSLMEFMRTLAEPLGQGRLLQYLDRAAIRERRGSFRVIEN